MNCFVRGNLTISARSLRRCLTLGSRGQTPDIQPIAEPFGVLKTKYKWRNNHDT